MIDKPIWEDLSHWNWGYRAPNAWFSRSECLAAPLFSRMNTRQDFHFLSLREMPRNSSKKVLQPAILATSHALQIPIYPSGIAIWVKSDSSSIISNISEVFSIFIYIIIYRCILNHNHNEIIQYQNQINHQSESSEVSNESLSLRCPTHADAPQPWAPWSHMAPGIDRDLGGRNGGVWKNHGKMWDNYFPAMSLMTSARYGSFDFPFQWDMVLKLEIVSRLSCHGENSWLWCSPLKRNLLSLYKIPMSVAYCVYLMKFQQEALWP